MSDLKIFLICILEDLEAAIMFVLGGMFMWILLLDNPNKWYYLGFVFFLAIGFNLLTELLWRTK